MVDRHKIELGKSLKDKLVRFNSERSGGPVHQVIAVDRDGMVDLHDMGGLFAPHLFTVADDIAAIPLPEAKPDQRDDALAKAREALLKLADFAEHTGVKGSWLDSVRTHIKEAIAALDAAKGAG